MTSEITEAMVDYIGRYGGRCRDCADEDGVCPPDMDGKKKLEERLYRWRLNSDKARVSVPLGELRSISDAYKAMEAENERLRKIVSECATALSNGAHIDPGCTVEFMGELPREIALRIASLQRGSRHEG